MEWLLVPAGVLLVLVGLLDVFFAMLHYDGFGFFLSSRIYNSLFDAVRFVTRLLPRTYRALGLSMAAPLMVPVTIMIWIFLVSLGYPLSTTPAWTQRSLLLEPASPAFFYGALYFSGVTIATLGLGDVTPLSGLYQTIASPRRWWASASRHRLTTTKQPKLRFCALLTDKETNVEVTLI